MWSKGLDFILFTNQNSARSSIWLADEKIVKSCNYYMLNSTITSGEFLKAAFKQSYWLKVLWLRTNQNQLENSPKRNFHIFLTMKQRWFMGVLLRFGEFYFWNFGKENNLNYRNHFQFFNIFIRFRSNSSDRKLCRVESSFLTVVVIWPRFHLSKDGQNWLMCIKIVWS